MWILILVCFLINSVAAILPYECSDATMNQTIPPMTVTEEPAEVFTINPILNCKIYDPTTLGCLDKVTTTTTPANRLIWPFKIPKKNVTQSNSTGIIKKCKTCLSSERIFPHSEIDCDGTYLLWNKTNGVYTIYPENYPKLKKIDVYCDMYTDGGGWIVIQRRGSFESLQDFNKGWEDYKNGFGKLTKDFWLGLEKIFAITNQKMYSLRIDMVTLEGQYRYSYHKYFWLENEASGYVLRVQGYSGNSSNDLKFNNRMPFSTRDRPHDGKSGSDICSLKHSGGWWYPKENCGFVNLNGIFLSGKGHDKANFWYHWTGCAGLEAIEMKIRTYHKH